MEDATKDAICRPGCRKEQSRRLHSFGGTAPFGAEHAGGRAGLVAWVRANRVGRAVMEASGGYERGWAEALRAAGVEVRIVDSKRVRHFAKAAGRLAKNDPIDADTIAWFAEAFPDRQAQPHDPAADTDEAGHAFQ